MNQELFDQLYVPVVSFIDKQIRDLEDARDIANNVFTKNFLALKGLDSDDDLTDVIRFLKKKALIEILNFRWKKKKRKKALEAFLESHDGDEESVEDIFITKEMYELIKKTKLSERQGKLMELFFSGAGSKKNAELMNISASTYRVAFRNAVKKYKLAFRAGGFLIILILLIICASAR